MPKTAPDRELASVSIKISLTPSEAELVEAACAAEDERKTGTWVRKAALRQARIVLGERAPDKKKARG